ncbi:pelargonidin 3-O-(6-caffeoylglucoside) 5-O-(6-O-malonylglucoside) 4'''-malonyltransferase-like [Rutidosis leptorrhynchoides]|uniref:pelargonidin 3-O-(6-caffeoylglucoside) 5-O-(6-O-malonylglucoside) 4'''-malonyltransferase-like n=1 Tax=Rutidosis leptorrhynchoides TaxID=125765 RepID=UPI003A9A05E9
MMKISKQSSTFIKPYVPTPQTHRHYRLSLFDEVVPFWNVKAILFFSPISGQIRKFIVGLETSLAKTLTHLYPLAGRYVDETQIVECNDEGVEFIHAEVNIKLQEILGSVMDSKMVDEFISLNTRAAHKLTDPLLSIQVTKFECGVVASKVQLVMAILSKAFIDLDRAINKHPRESIVMQPMNLRGKMASLIPKHSCGNLLAYCIKKSGIFETTIELADVINDSIKKAVNNYSKVHHDTEEGKSMVWDSILQMANIAESTHVIGFTSWCKFPFYEANFGFGKPIWVAPGTVPLKNSAYLMDDAGGNGVEAHVFLEVNDVPMFEKSQNANALRS